MADRSDKPATPEDQRLLVAVSDRIATITLNRPEARNAMTKRMRNDLCAALRAADADDGVDAIILTGTDPVSPAASGTAGKSSSRHGCARGHPSGKHSCKNPERKNYSRPRPAEYPPCQLTLRRCQAE